MSGTDFDLMRAAMVSNQLRTHAVTDEIVLGAMMAVPRERFVPAAHVGVAYRDTIVPLGAGRGLNPAVATGRLLGAARPRAGEHVLLVGAGTGYVAALLSKMGAQVTALEEAPELITAARLALADTPNVTLVEGPLTAGWPGAAPYDLIYIDGTVDVVPDAIIDQLKDNEGRLAAALNDRGVSRLVIGRRAASGFGVVNVADIETSPLPGFARAPAFTF
jgi:protein-L-isoaspartate(D-aspartate) O-methyltransferase